MTPQEQAAAWEKQGFFILRGMFAPHETSAVEKEVVDRIRQDPPERHPAEEQYFSGPNYLLAQEKKPGPSARNPEDRVSKVFNCHAEGLTRRMAESAGVVEVVARLLGPDVDCFQSQFIFKNPGVMGQPWHQDSYYFRFDLQPQVGVWIALSRATQENGCLWVVPGSHRQAIHEHVPDPRTGANRGYLVIVGQDTSGAIPVLMEPGDVLFFHSYLMHQSTDNVADYRRSAMVFHYGRAGTKVADPEWEAPLARVQRWIPVRRQRAA